LRRVRVCIADHDAEAASALASGLAAHDYQSVVVASGAEAVETCRRGDAEIILLAVDLPDARGFEICRRLKDAPETRDVGVIFVLPQEGEVDLAEGYHLGAAGFVTKPLNVPMVMIRVEAASRARQTLDRLNAEDPFQDSIYTDELTGLKNRRYLLERLQEEVEKARRYDYPLSCVLFDLDQIEAVDDELGPASLDDLLIELAMALRSFSRSCDVLARYDGTVFAAVLPHTPIEHAQGYAGKIMDEVNATTFSDPSFPTQARLSVGLVGCRNSECLGAEFLLGEAMQSLLQAKSTGGERLTARNV
jgi:diguanylate cyclase (GGDEF)-like protein